MDDHLSKQLAVVTDGYSAFMGRAQEVAKRRNMIERLERAQDRGVLVCAVPQVSDLTVTQLSMFLRRLFKSTPGLREFVGDGVMSHIFEDASPQTTAAVEHPTADLGNDKETSAQPDFYHTRRNILSADYFATSLLRTIMDKQERLKSFPFNEKFEHEKPTETTSCARCRPLVELPKRQVFRVQNAPSFYRASSPPPSAIVNERNTADYGYENRDIRMLDVSDPEMEIELQAYMNRLGQLPPHYAVKNYVAFPEIGARNDFHGMSSVIKSEVVNFPYPLSDNHGGKKKRQQEGELENDSNDEEENSNNYPLLQKVRTGEESLKRTFPLRAPPTKIRRQEPSSSKPPEPKLTPLKIRRPKATSALLYPLNSSVVQQKVEEDPKPRISLSIRIPQPGNLAANEKPTEKSPSSAQSTSSSNSSSSTDSDDEGDSRTSSSSDSESAPSSPKDDTNKTIDTSVETQPTLEPSASANIAVAELIGVVSSGDESDNESSNSEVIYDLFVNGAYHASVRYSALYSLHEKLLETFGMRLGNIEFPPKRVWKNLDAETVNKRREGLAKYFHGGVRWLKNFESPYVSQQLVNRGADQSGVEYRLGIRKVLWDPIIEEPLLDDPGALRLLYLQAVNDLQRGVFCVCQESKEKLIALQKEDQWKQFMHVCHKQASYGYEILAPVRSDYPVENTVMNLKIGRRQLFFEFREQGVLSQLVIKSTRIRIWRVSHNDSNVDMSFQIEFLVDKQTGFRQIVLYTSQAVLLSLFLQAIAAEILHDLSQTSKVVENLQTSKANSIVNGDYSILHSTEEQVPADLFKIISHQMPFGDESFEDIGDDDL
ncbi:hypothetical protein M3Y94_00805500 [Aphelenchoides besseyi]|nr:hypothetical protein M3Y94_00805500 [Aphelenchoides besseyi]